MYSRGRELRIALLTVIAGATSIARADSRGSAGFYMQEGRTYAEIPALRAPISESDLERWDWIMQLDESQASQVRVIHQGYVEREEAMHLEHVQPLWDLSAEIFGPVPNSTSVTCAEAYTAILGEPRNKALREQRRVDNDFFAQVALILNEHQVASLQRVRLERERSWAVRTHWGYPGSHIDLTRWLFELHRGGLDLPQSDEWEAHWDQYATFLSLLCREREEALVRVKERGVVLFAQRLSGLGDAAALFNQERNLRRRLVDVEKRVHDLNVLYIDVTGRAFSSAVSDQLRDRFRRSSYPPAFPDVTDPRAVLDAAVSIRSLSEEQRAKIESLTVDILASRDAITLRIVAEFLRWREQWGIEQRGQNILIPEYEKGVRPLHDQRVALSELALSMLESILTHEQIEPTLPSIHTVREAMLQPFVPDPSFMSAPPPPTPKAKRVAPPAP